MEEDCSEIKAERGRRADRRQAEQEAGLDLKKSTRQLLADVHEELLHCGRTAEHNVAHAYKRIASIMVRSADSSERASKVLVMLTVVITFLTLVLVVLTVVMIVKR